MYMIIYRQNGESYDSNSFFIERPLTLPPIKYKPFFHQTHQFCCRWHWILRFYAFLIFRISRTTRIKNRVLKKRAFIQSHISWNIFQNNCLCSRNKLQTVTWMILNIKYYHHKSIWCSKNFLRWQNSPTQQLKKSFFFENQFDNQCIIVDKSLLKFSNFSAIYNKTYVSDEKMVCALGGLGSMVYPTKKELES